MAVFVCSPQASATAGATLRVDGGVIALDRVRPALALYSRPLGLMPAGYSGAPRGGWMPALMTGLPIRG